MLVRYALWILPICKICSIDRIWAHKTNEQQKQAEMIIYSGLALLFQPFFKIALGREIWNVVDVVVGIGLIGSLITNKTKS